MPKLKILLDEEEIPKQWYNITPDLPKPLPPFIDPETKAPGAGIVPRIFPGAILGQEMSKERWIDIPEEVRDVYRLWRPRIAPGKILGTIPAPGAFVSGSFLDRE